MRDAVQALIADPRSALIALDFDGTLAPIVARPADARLLPGGLEVLQRLAGSIRQVAVISGRGAEEVVDLGGLDRVPRIRVMGHYGLQTWRDGVLSSPPIDPGVDLAKRRLPELLATAPSGVYVEDKHHSVAVHTRPAAQPQQALDTLAPTLRTLALEAGLEAVPGRFVIELRPAGIDKGSALRDLIAEVGATTVIYVGDDVGDLPAFRAVTSLHAAGAIAGLAVAAVGDDNEVPGDLRDAADLELPGPDGVVAWLTGLADSIDG